MSALPMRWLGGSERETAPRLESRLPKQHLELVLPSSPRAKPCIGDIAPPGGPGHTWLLVIVYVVYMSGNAVFDYLVK